MHSLFIFLLRGTILININAGKVFISLILVNVNKNASSAQVSPAARGARIRWGVWFASYFRINFEIDLVIYMGTLWPEINAKVRREPYAPANSRPSRGRRDLARETRWRRPYQSKQCGRQRGNAAICTVYSSQGSADIAYTGEYRLF